MRTFTVTALCAMFLAVGCGKPQTQPRASQVRDFEDEAPEQDTLQEVRNTTTRNSDQPKWVDNPTLSFPGYIAVVGFARPNGLKDVYLQRTTATNRGMAELATRLEADVQRLMEDTQQSKTVNKGKKIVNQSEDTQRHIIQTKVRRKLSNIQVPSYWTDRQTGNLYVLIRVPESAAHEIAKEVDIQGHAASIEHMHKEFNRDTTTQR